MHLYSNHHHLNNSTAVRRVISLPARTKHLLKERLCSTGEAPLSNAYLVVDERWNIQYWNGGSATLTGIPAEKISGSNLWKSLAAYLPASLVQNYRDKPLADIPAFVQVYSAELNCRLSLHTWHYLDQLYISISHIGESSTAESNEIASALDLYKLVAEISNDCCWDREAGTQEIFWIDGGHQRIFGYTIQNKLVPQHFWEDCIHPDDRARVQYSYQELFTASGSAQWECEYQFRKADGRYIYVHDRAKVFYDASGSITRVIGTTQDIHQRKSAEMSLVTELLSRQHEISGSVLSAQEQERTHIGEELHDNIGQILAAAKMYIQQSMAYSVKKDAHLEKALTYIVDVMNEIRRISRALVIPSPAIISLQENIRILVMDFNLLHPVKVVFNHNLLPAEELPEILQTNIFRIVQEQLSNIVRHSGAGKAVVSLQKSKGILRLLITDNGKGLLEENQAAGVGLINIRSRVGLNKGLLQLVTPGNRGFILEAVFPMD